MRIIIFVMCMMIASVSFAIDVIQSPCNGGRFYNAQGKFVVRIDSNGKQYDATGRYQGKTESNGKVYDKNGRLKGTWR